MMAQMLEKNNIPIPNGARKKDGSSNSDNKEECHAFVASYYNPSTFIIDSGESRNMASTRDIFSSIHLSSGLVVRMGDDFEIHTK